MVSVQLSTSALDVQDVVEDPLVVDKLLDEDFWSSSDSSIYSPISSRVSVRSSISDAGGSGFLTSSSSVSMTSDAQLASLGMSPIKFDRPETRPLFFSEFGEHSGGVGGLTSSESTKLCTSFLVFSTSSMYSCFFLGSSRLTRFAWSAKNNNDRSEASEVAAAGATVVVATWTVVGKTDEASVGEAMLEVDCGNAEELSPGGCLEEAGEDVADEMLGVDETPGDEGSGDPDEAPVEELG